MSSIWIILMYVAWDVLYLAIGAQTTTALWGHTIGFLAGFVVSLALLLTGVLKPTQDERSILGLFGRA